MNGSAGEKARVHRVSLTNNQDEAAAAKLPFCREI
jgi:hypothetical protein